MSSAKPLILFLFFVSAFLIITGIYEQRIAALEKTPKIEYRFIPRTFYEEQMAYNNTVTDKLSNFFQGESPWYDRTIGVLADTDFIKKQKKSMG
jgi:hypothetical protein